MRILREKYLQEDELRQYNTSNSSLNISMLCSTDSYHNINQIPCIIHSWTISELLKAQNQDNPIIMYPKEHNLRE